MLFVPKHTEWCITYGLGWWKPWVYLLTSVARPSLPTGVWKLFYVSKERILQDVSKDGNIDVLMCTIAFGLGINIKNLSIIVHWGAPKNCI